MRAEFDLQADPSRDLVRIWMSGFFSSADIDAFLAARRDAHARLTCGRNRHVTLNDVRGLRIQSQDAVVAFQRVLAEPQFRSRRLAFLVSPTLARSQLNRALAGREARFFGEVTAAEHWLLAPEAEAFAS